MIKVKHDCAQPEPIAGSDLTDAEILTLAREHHCRYATAVIGSGRAGLSGWLHDHKRTAPGG